MGLTITLRSLIEAEVYSPLLISISILFMGLYALGIIAGFNLIEERKLGIQLSLVYQALQTIMVYSNAHNSPVQLVIKGSVK